MTKLCPKKKNYINLHFFKEGVIDMENMSDIINKEKFLDFAEISCERL